MAYRGDWNEYRREMIAETEEFINRGLKNPDMVDFIPSKSASKGGFPKKIANWFYNNVFFKE